MSPVNVVWAMVSYGPMPFPAVYASHLQAVAHASRVLTERGDGSKIGGLGASDRMYTHSAESQMVVEALEAGATHVFLTEQDMTLPVDVIPKLLALDKPVAAGLYFLRNGRGQPCLYIKSFTPANNRFPHAPVTAFPPDQPFPLGPRGGCPGLGCVLFRREVFEAIEPPWFDLKEKNPKTGEGYGSDMYAFTKIRDAGFEVWVDPTVRCGHMDYVEVGYDDYVKRCQEDPGFPGSGAIVNAPEVLA